MAKHLTTAYTCERCDKRLKTCENTLDIVTDLDGGGSCWSRLHVSIIHRHGMHNDGKEEMADLCRACALVLLEDAMKRIRDGERTTAGTHGSDQGNWE